MELKNCIEKDYQHSLEQADQEAKLPIEKIVMFLKSFSLGDKERTSQLISSNYIVEEEAGKKSMNNTGHIGQTPIASTDDALLQVMEEPTREQSTIIPSTLPPDPKLVRIPKKGKDILFSILHEYLQEEKVESPIPLPPKVPSKDPALDNEKVTNSTDEKKPPQEQHDNILELEPVAPMQKPFPTLNPNLDQASMMSSLSDSMVNGYIPSKVEPAPLPPRGNTLNNRPKSSGHHLRPSVISTTANNPKQEEGKDDHPEKDSDSDDEDSSDDDDDKAEEEKQTGTGKKKKKKGTIRRKGTSEKKKKKKSKPSSNIYQLKNLLEEYRKETNQKPYRNPLHHTLQYADMIHTEIERAIDNVYPELKYTFNTLLSRPFQEGKSMTEIVEAVRKLLISSSARHYSQHNVLLSNQFTDPSYISQHHHLPTDSTLKQSLETVVEGLHAMRSLQHNCSKVAQEAIVTVRTIPSLVIPFISPLIFSLLFHDLFGYVGIESFK